MSDNLLGAAQIRKLASELDLIPTKKLGQNFVIDPNTVRRIVDLAQIDSNDVVVEIGPGLGSLTLGLLESAKSVIAVEIDARLADQLSRTVAGINPELLPKLTVVNQDALQVSELPSLATKLVANLPYNISVPVILHFLDKFPDLSQIFVMVQAEVGERLAAAAGSKVYGVPSVKARYYAEAKLVAHISRQIFWPVPNVDSVLVRLVRHENSGTAISKTELFPIIDGAFSQRRKTLRSALSNHFGGTEQVERVLRLANIDPKLRGEQLDYSGFLAIAMAAREVK